jgi:hypothetical protein
VYQLAVAVLAQEGEEEEGVGEEEVVVTSWVTSPKN